MDRANIIHDLLNWIETHLDQPLLLDNVAAKSGYSKWHLQRMFRSTTGHALGSYIRERRLSQAAQALRTTPRPILDIALQFHFDSQPSFSRAFKKQFGKTPAVYRRTPQRDGAEPRSPGITGYRHASPSLQLLYNRQCLDDSCTHWMGQR